MQDDDHLATVLCYAERNPLRAEDWTRKTAEEFGLGASLQDRGRPKKQ